MICVATDQKTQSELQLTHTIISIGITITRFFFAVCCVPMACPRHRSPISLSLSHRIIIIKPSASIYLTFRSLSLSFSLSLSLSILAIVRRRNRLAKLHAILLSQRRRRPVIDTRKHRLLPRQIESIAHAIGLPCILSFSLPLSVACVITTSNVVMTNDRSGTSCMYNATHAIAFADCQSCTVCEIENKII